MWAVGIPPLPQVGFSEGAVTAVLAGGLCVSADVLLWRRRCPLVSFMREKQLVLGDGLHHGTLGGDSQLCSGSKYL